MKIYTRYILNKFSINVFLVYVTFVFVYVIFDFTANLSDILNAGSFSQIITTLPSYYFTTSFVFIDLTIPLLLAASALMTLGFMDLSNEVIALQAIGVSPSKIVLPIIGASLCFSLFFTAVREVYLPKHLVEISLKPAEILHKSESYSVRRAHDYKSHIVLDGDKINYETNVMSNPSVSLSSNLSVYGNRIIASEAEYLPASENRQSGWLFKRVKKPLELASKDSLRDERLGETIVYFPKDASWLNEDEAFIVTSLKPVHLITGENCFQYGATADLMNSLMDPTFQNDAVGLTIRAHSRIWRPVTDLIPLFLATPFIFMKRDKNVFLAMGQGVLLAILFVLVQQTCSYLSNQLKWLELGIWGSIFVFVPIATILWWELTGKTVRTNA